jgi:hypothetical protein
MTKGSSVLFTNIFWTLFALLLLGSDDKTVVGTEFKFDGDELLSHIVSPLPYSYMNPSKLPQNFYWGNVGGRSYLTHMLNQHIPQCKTEAWMLGKCLIFNPDVSGLFSLLFLNQTVGLVGHIAACLHWQIVSRSPAMVKDKI